MAERNLLNEGFIFNTRDSTGAISGTQVVSAGEIESLVDGDTSTDALTLNVGQFISLDSDLGVRWKTDRIELYTDEPTISNVAMLISEDGVDYREVTMTGSTGLYVGDLPETAVSGSPRFVRYQHTGVAANTIQEWRVVNDETLVDFGTDGDQTLLNIDDSPIGTTSSIPEPLTLFNRFDKIANAFVFVDSTSNDAEDQIQVSSSINGPFVGRGDNSTTQPANVPWEFGEFSNTRVVPSGSAFIDFIDNDLKGWEATAEIDNFTLTNQVLQGEITAVSGARFQVVNSFDNFFLNNQDLITGRARNEDKFVLRAADVDQVKVRLKVNPLPSTASLVEGPRLYWRNHEEETDESSDFRESVSTLSTTPNSNFNNQVQDFVFDVGSVPTWSGTIRGFAVSPFQATGSIGTNIPVEFHSLEAFNSQSKQSSFVTLDFRQVTSGTFPIMDLDDASRLTNVKHLLSFRTQITQDCVITNVQAWVRPDPNDPPVIYLARPLAGSSFPSAGSNFDVVAAVDSTEAPGGNNDFLLEIPVFWSAQKGDMVGISFQGAFGGDISYRGTTNVGDLYSSDTTAGTASLTELESIVNTHTDWTARDENILLTYTALPTELDRSPVASPTLSGGYFSAGTYTTPVFDTGNSPNLSCLDFDSITPGDSSIDASGGPDADVALARASNFVPRTGLALGEVGVISGTGSKQTRTLNFIEPLNFQKAIDNNPDHAYQLNQVNFAITTREFGNSPGPGLQFIQNVGSAIFYHETKDELWILNTLISGTDPFSTLTNRPIWDVYAPVTGEYIRTQQVTGTVFYSYQHPSADAVFEPVGFVADYNRGEIYIIQRENAFFLGAGSYYGLVLDLDGNIIDVFWRDGVTSAPSSNRFESARDVAYAPDVSHPPLQEFTSGMFFIIGDNSGTGTAGELISAYTNGTDISDRDITHVGEKRFGDIVGLTFMGDNNPDAKAITYNPKDGFIYVMINDPEGDNETGPQPQIFALRPFFNSGSEEMDFELVIGPEDASNSGPRLDGAGFGRQSAGSADDSDLIRLVELNYTTSMAYNSLRDTFVILRTIEGLRSEDALGASRFSLFDEKSFSTINECGAGTNPSLGNLPNAISITDKIWGTLSGTLDFEQVPTDSTLFPAGRYVQLEYQLNSSADNAQAPQITSSQICQGLNVGQIPANSTREIFVRTNIPANQPIGDLLGRLKVFWELED